jgi:DNA-directed RNA polymerase subunit RPC12/RpoP
MKQMSTPSPYICYRCHRPVNYADLVDIDSEIDNMDETLMAIIAEEFVNCVGDKAMFHDDGVVNCCPRCYNQLITHQDPPLIREIVCPNCDEWEELGVDDPRWKSQWFRFIKLEEFGSEAVYECPQCKTHVMSRLIPIEDSVESPPSIR